MNQSHQLWLEVQRIRSRLYWVKSHQLPRFTFKQHFNDCFGWAICLK